MWEIVIGYVTVSTIDLEKEGSPGPRTNDFYAAYFRDPDGNKQNVFYMQMAESLNSSRAFKSCG